MLGIALAATACAPVPYLPIAEPGDIETYAETNRFRLGRPRSIRVTSDDKVLFVRPTPPSKNGDLWEVDVATGKERVLLTAATILGDAMETLSAEERSLRERKRQVAHGIASYSLSKDSSKLLVPLSGRLYVVNRASGAVSEVPAAGKGAPFDARFSPDGGRIAFVRRGDLYTTELSTGAETQLTTRAGDHEVWGLAEFVAQEEMQRYHGYWWSPDGAHLVAQRTDSTDVERLWISNPATPARKPTSSPYPRAGTANATVGLSILPVAGGEGVPIAWDRGSYPYLVSVRWRKDAPLTLVVQNRLQTESLLLVVDPATGKTTTLHRERDDAWINIDQDVPRWLPGGEHFLWTSERNGDWQLELRARDGSLTRTLTPVELGYQGLVHVDPKGESAIIRARAGVLHNDLFRVPIAGGEVEQLTDQTGNHGGLFGDSGSWVHQRADEDGTRTWTVRDGQGATKGELRSLAAAPPWIPNVELTTVGKEALHAAIVRPRNFDASRRYPVIVYVYGGPHYRVVRADRSAYYVQQWIADHGFIMAMIDGHGTPDRGRAWERAIKHDVISGPLDDQVAGLQALAERYPEMDTSRVGVYGWSFGGYLTIMALLRRPGVYHAGFSGAPVTDWRHYDTHYTERYMGLPAEQRAAYDSTSAVVHAGKLERPLLVAHGTADDNVYFVHTLELSRALFEAGKPHEILPISGHTHAVRGKKAMLALYTRVAHFFVRSLNP